MRKVITKGPKDYLGIGSKRGSNMYTLKREQKLKSQNERKEIGFSDISDDRVRYMVSPST